MTHERGKLQKFSSGILPSTARCQAAAAGSARVTDVFIPVAIGFIHPSVDRFSFRPTETLFVRATPPRVVIGETKLIPCESP